MTTTAKSVPAKYTSEEYPAPCRLCGGPSWMVDEEGSVHPCCELMWTSEGGCRSCRTSGVMNAEQRRRKGQKVSQPIGYKGT